MEFLNELSDQDSQIVVRWNAYHREIEAIERKLVNDRIPSGKREKLNYRIKIIKTKLIPQLMQEMRKIEMIEEI